MQATNLEEILWHLTSLSNQISQISLSSTRQSNTAEILLSIVPIIAITLGGVLLFFFLLWQYKLRKALIGSGQYTPSSIRNIRILSLLFGINGLLIGAPLTLIFLIVNGVNYSLLGGLIPLCLGTGMLIFYSVIRKQD